jgi:hypothetical protein
MFDGSLAAGLFPMLSSFSRIDFSDETMRRDAMVAEWSLGVYGSVSFVVESWRVCWSSGNALEL